MRPGRRDFARAFLRSFSIQGSWNYRTLIGAGLGYAMTPLLARIYAGDPVRFQAALERHSGEFNSHPYLSPVAIGALARLEYEGEDPAKLMRIRTALPGPLGALGDGAVWAGWRPFCVLTAAITFLLGLGPIAAATGFLVVYNLGHVGLRLWGLKCGWESGSEVGAALKRLPLRRVGRALVRANLVLIGTLIVLLGARTPGVTPHPWVMALGVAAALGGYLLPRWVAGPAMASIFVACIVWLL